MTPATGTTTYSSRFLGVHHVAGLPHRHIPRPRRQLVFSTMPALSTAVGNKVFDKPLPQLESELAGVFRQLQEHGSVLVVVDQPNTIGALPIAVARACGCEVGYLPGLAMRKAADLYPGRAKTSQTRRIHHCRHRPNNASHAACRRPK